MFFLECFLCLTTGAGFLRCGPSPMPDVLMFFNIGIIGVSYAKNKMLIRTTLSQIAQISEKIEQLSKSGP